MKDIKATECTDCAYHSKWSCNNMDKKITVIQTPDNKDSVVLCDGKKTK
jgi:hypothetical protein